MAIKEMYNPSFYCRSLSLVSSSWGYTLPTVACQLQDDYDYSILHKVQVTFSLAMTISNVTVLLGYVSPSALVRCIVSPAPRDFTLTHEQFQIIVKHVSFWPENEMPAASCIRDSLVDLLWDRSWAGKLFWLGLRPSCMQTSTGSRYVDCYRTYHSMLHSILSTPPGIALPRETYT